MLRAGEKVDPKSYLVSFEVWGLKTRFQPSTVEGQTEYVSWFSVTKSLKLISNFNLVKALLSSKPDLIVGTLLQGADRALPEMMKPSPLASLYLCEIN